MKVSKPTDVFNMMDTNGRRKDIINAYGIYLNILQELEKSDDSSWDRFPTSLNQYKFYQQAINASPDVFKKHAKFDKFQEALNAHSDLNDAFQNKDAELFTTLFQKYSTLDPSTLDKDIEARSRHYTSNLVKMGFTDDKRKLSSVGTAFVNGLHLERDPFEELLPIKDGNLIFLRQLLKLKIYTKNYDAFYSPMLLVLYLLMNVKRIDQNTLLNLAVMINPFTPVNPQAIKTTAISNTDDFYSRYSDFSQDKNLAALTDQPKRLNKETFTNFFKNKKSTTISNIYYQFYLAIIKYQETGNADELFQVYNDNTKTIDSAFGFGGHIFKWRRGKKTLQQFVQDNKNQHILTTKSLNTTLYQQYLSSTRYVSVMEYSDTFRRLLRASGIVSFNNGIAELMYTDLWKELFKDVDMQSLISGQCDSKQAKKNDTDPSADFRNNISITKIVKISDVSVVISRIQESLGIDSAEGVKNTLLSQKDSEFKTFVKTTFPKNKILQILPLFEDRSNDQIIKSLVDTDASVPTIYEYIVGLAWYYISDVDYNLYKSFNLSMNANFRPETHAAGGEGDIVIDYKKQTLMIEVTLMNKQAQKRGEWEPVLRHTTNLTIEKAPEKVQTLFVADELDQNTINIWRAVASVPMRSSRESYSDKTANNVTIMPIKNNEMCRFLESNISSAKLLNQISQSFEALKNDFDEAWRISILKNVL
ncbi:MAG: AlwI family type II restriction endonuclease [Enterococcus avium]|nr:AlwI family type II restriction endonuclease [Enterococcus avium]